MRVIEPFYYLDNFRSMLETLKRRDGDPVSLCCIRWNATVA